MLAKFKAYIEEIISFPPTNNLLEAHWTAFFFNWNSLHARLNSPTRHEVAEKEARKD